MAPRTEVQPSPWSGREQHLLAWGFSLPSADGIKAVCKGWALAANGEKREFEIAHFGDKYIHSTEKELFITQDLRTVGL